MTETKHEVMVETRGLQKTYGPTVAVDSISFEVSRGEVVGFLGPNGAGKTTTMQMLTGFLKPNKGTARINGIDLSDDPKKAQMHLGYLPENAPLYNEMMVVDFLKFVADLRQVPAEQQQTRLNDICNRCGLSKVLGKDIGQLSKGYRQRVGLAQAMVHDPDLIVLDEPTSGLDPNQIVEIRELIKELGRDKTVILSTHILPEVQATCDRIIIINEGKIVADDRTEVLTLEDAGAVIKIVVKNKDKSVINFEQIREVFSNLPGIRTIEDGHGEGEGTIGLTLRATGDQDPREAVFSTVVAQNLILLDMHRERVSLEDTFRRLTRGEGGHHA